MKISNNRGFTLIELMIVVVIVAILASIALPAYTEQIRKGRRSDGIAAAMQIAQAQERFFTQNFQYASAIDTDLGYSADPYISEEGYYSVAIIIPGACAGGGSPTCFNVVATAITAQLDDTNCRTLTINDRGQKTSASSAPADTTGQCW